MISCAVAVLFSLALAACGTTALTRAGSNVRTVTQDERDCCCESLGQVSGARSSGMSADSNMESVYNMLRNKTAKLGGNAMYIIDRTTLGSVYQGLTATGIAEALRCDFDKIKAPKETKK
jgi:hypothetical protein